MTRYRTSFDTDEQAVVEALFLGLMAPGESETEAAATLAAELAAGMDEATWRSARTRALSRRVARETSHIECQEVGSDQRNEDSYLLYGT